jgi:branched-chain amino acid transport system substrate-binding protein
LREHSFSTVVGTVKFGAKGEWAQSRVLQVQYQTIKEHDIDRFKDMSTQVVVAPAKYASGEVIYPYERAK